MTKNSSLLRDARKHLVQLENNRGIISSFFTFTFCIIFLYSLQTHFQPYAINGIYFQEWSSEDMMQTVSIIDLRDHPWQSLLFIHIQPPLLDFIRLVAAQVWHTTNYQILLTQVDKTLYFCWLISYAFMGVIIFRWLSKILINKFAAFVFAILFIIHPATIFYSTFLEGTFLTSLGVLWLCYSLWRLSRGSSIWPLIFSYLFLFSVRSIFQWPAIIIIVISMVLCRVSPKKVLTFILLTGIITTGFMAKQYLIFGTISSSSFSGSSCLHSLGVFPGMGLSEIDLSKIKLGPLFPKQSLKELPSVLTRSKKLTGKHNFNSLADLKNERDLIDNCLYIFLSQPAQSTIISYFHNMMIYFKASSQYYTDHIIVDRLFWRPVYDFLFSGLPLFLMLVLSSISWLLSHKKIDLPYGIGLILPVVFVFASCVLFEKVENMRYKFFVEPVLYIFIISQLFSVINYINFKSPVFSVRTKSSAEKPNE